MSKQPTPHQILDLDREHLREIDGVVLDMDSYARHAETAPTPEPQTEPAAPSAGQPVFAADPQHAGWYPKLEPMQIPYPIMAGAVPPQTETQTVQVCCTGSGSYAGSYLTSYTASFSTSFLTSFYTSWRISSYFSSGSGSYLGSGSSLFPGGFGLELI